MNDRERKKWQRMSGGAMLLLSMLVLVEFLTWLVLPFHGYDNYCQTFWIGEWHRMWNAGIFYPRWLPASFAGFGAPSFYYYPPLTYFVSSTLATLLPQLSAAAIGKLVGLLAFAGSGFSMWAYLRSKRARDTASADSRMVSRSWELWGAMLYVVAPYHFFDYSVRSALSEHVALIFVPFVFWGIDLLLHSDTQTSSALRSHRRGAILLTFSLSLLFITNLPASAVAGIGAIVYVAILGKRIVRSLLLLCCTALLAAMLAAFYLFPVAVLYHDVQLGRLWMPASVILSSPFLALFSGKNLLINSYDFLSVIGAVMLLAGLWFRMSRAADSNRPSGNVRVLFWMTVVVLMLQLPFVSRELFNFVPPFTIIQLAARFDILLLFAVAVVWHEEGFERKQEPGSSRGVVFVRNAASIVVGVWAIGGIALAAVQLANLHVHPYGGLPVGEAPEYAPRWSRPYYDFGASLSAPFPNDRVWAVWQGNSQPSQFQFPKQRAPYSDTIDYDAASAGQILLRRSYWPTWHASLDGNPVATAPDSLGRLTIAAPAGRHRLTTKLAPEPSAVIGAWISAGAVVVTGIAWFVL